MATPMNEANLLRLVNEMGFPRSEAIMALTDCNGNIELSVQKLIEGEYAPPPYTELSKSETEPVYNNLLELGPMPNKSGSQSNNNSKYELKLPPYSRVCLKDELKSWENESSADFFKLEKVNPSKKAEMRCSSCFDEIIEMDKSGPFNKAVKDGMRDYHYDCFIKTRGPKCAYCSFPLTKIDLDRNFSGQFIIYEGRKYHVECYEQYAGPRCSYCFNVIIEVMSGNKVSGGRWIGENNKMFHEECFCKKMQSEERAKNS